MENASIIILLTLSLEKLNINMLQLQENMTAKKSIMHKKKLYQKLGGNFGKRTIKMQF